MKAVRVHEYGGPEVLSYEEVREPEPAAGEALVQMQVIGINYSDTHYRRGSYAGGVLPLIPGHEGGGVILRLGDGVTAFKPGDRVVFAGQHRRGTYKELMAVPAEDLVPIPDDLDMKLATAVLNQGRTAHYLTRDARPVEPGERVLVHAAAGGVGSLLVQMAKSAGGRVYATVSTQEKADYVRGLGADEVIFYTRTDFELEIQRLTNGDGVNVIYDALGGDSLVKNLRSLARRGHLVTYGQTSGRPPPLEWPQRGLGSVYLSYHTGADYTRPGGEGLQRAEDLFHLLREGHLKVHVHKEFALSEAAQAHRELEDRKTIGKLLLMP
jgi:NADPH2:quinone reductase